MTISVRSGMPVTAAVINHRRVGASAGGGHTDRTVSCVLNAQVGLSVASAILHAVAFSAVCLLPSYACCLMPEPMPAGSNPLGLL